MPVLALRKITSPFWRACMVLLEELRLATLVVAEPLRRLAAVILVPKAGSVPETKLRLEKLVLPIMTSRAKMRMVLPDALGLKMAKPAVSAAAAVCLPVVHEKPWPFCIQSRIWSAEG